MFKSYFKITLRTLVNQRGYAFINILGLAIGMACCLLIVIYVADQFSYDRHHRDAQQLYRVATEIITPEREMRIATSPAPLGPALARDFPEVETAVRLMRPPGVSQHIFRYGDKQFFEPQGCWVDADFFSLFAYDFLLGDPATALSAPGQVVLSERLARKIFGDDAPAGKTIQIDDNFGAYDYLVTGVFAEPRHNSHISAEFFVSLNSPGIGAYAYRQHNWAGNNFLHTYIRVRAGSDPAAIAAKFPALLAQYATDDLAEAGMKKAHFLQPVTGIYLHSNLAGEVGRNGNARYLYMLSAIAAFLLLIACINFVNLATARATRRAREVGVRKAIGGHRAALAVQFIAESTLLVLLALALAIVFVEMALPAFNQLIEGDLALRFDGAGIAVLLVLVLVVALGAGSYPAFFLGSLKPVHALQGTTGEGLSTASLRKGMVVCQFVISIVLIIGVTVIEQQLNFMQRTDLGFAREHRLVLPYRTAEAVEQQTAFKQALLRDHAVRSATITSTSPGDFIVYDNQFFKAGETVDQAVICKIIYGDFDMVMAMGFEIISGRDFSRERPTDQQRAILVNEATLATLGIAVDAAPGARLQAIWNDSTYTFEIAGVVRNFHFQSLHELVRPMVLLLPRNIDLPYLVAHVQTGDMPGLLERVEALWHDYVPQVPFDFSFVDAQIGRLYTADQRLATLAGAFTIIAIVISCLGLLGLATFAAEQRTKEIGIRKVLGASVASVTALLSKDFVKLVLLANLIAWPVAWLAMNQWLQNFAYRIEISWWVFALAGGLALLIALLTVSTQAVRAAMANPVESLRSE